MSITLILPDRRDLEDLIARALPAAAVAAVSVITRRTAQGIDMHGAPFAPYTTDYARNKAQSGRRASPPDLNLTGQTMRNLKVKTPTSAVDTTFGQPRREVRIGFDGQRRDTQFRARGAPAVTNVGSRREARLKTLQRLPSTTPMAVIVQANQRRRPFFGIRTTKDQSTVVRAFERAMNAEIRKRNAEAQRQANTAAVAGLARRGAA